MGSRFVCKKPIHVGCADWNSEFEFFDNVAANLHDTRRVMGTRDVADKFVRCEGQRHNLCRVPRNDGSVVALSTLLSFFFFLINWGKNKKYYFVRGFNQRLRVQASWAQHLSEIEGARISDGEKRRTVIV